MKKIKKRILSFVLAMMMVVSLMPVQVYAANVTSIGLNIDWSNLAFEAGMTGVDFDSSHFTYSGTGVRYAYAYYVVKVDESWFVETGGNYSLGTANSIINDALEYDDGWADLDDFMMHRNDGGMPYTINSTDLYGIHIEMSADTDRSYRFTQTDGKYTGEVNANIPNWNPDWTSVITIEYPDECLYINVPFTLAELEAMIPSGPTIDSNPENVAKKAGETATFTVVAPEATGYQWQIKNGDSFENIPNANAATYETVVSGACGTVYTYRCAVSNGEGATTNSAEATLTVEHSWATEKNERGHWFECSECDETDGDNLWEAKLHTDENSDNKCDVCDYVVYHVTLNANSYTDIVVVYLCDSSDSVFVEDIVDGETFVVPEKASVKVIGRTTITDAKAPGASIAFADGEGVPHTACIVSNFTRNTTIVLNPIRETYTITLERSNYPDDTQLKLEVYDASGEYMNDATISEDGQTTSLKEGGRLIVGTGTTDNFKVKVEGANATVSEQMDEDGYYFYIITDVEGSATVVVEPKTVVTPDPEPTPNPNPTPNPEPTPGHTHTLTEVAATAATCTTAGNNKYYKCDCGKYFTDVKGTTETTVDAATVKALGHDMTEATCTEPATCKRTGCTHTTDELGHDWSGEWTTIKEATATEEGKKETLCTRECGQKKVVIIPKTGEVDTKENFEKDAEVAPDAPFNEVTLNNTKEELLDSDIFTDKEKQAIKDGEDARVWLEVDKVDEDTIPSDDKAKVEDEAEKIAGENATITYFDASLFKQVGTGKKTGIEKPGMDMKITIVIPKELLNNDKNMDREYKIIRLHKGVVDIIIGTYNDETGEYSFETDRFSTYAIVYADSPVEETTPGNDTTDGGNTNTNQGANNNDVSDSFTPTDNQQLVKDDVPKTGESTDYAMILWTTILAISVVGLVLNGRKRAL